MSRRRQPDGPLQPFVVRFTASQLWGLDCEAQRRRMTRAALLRDIIAAYLSTPATHRALEEDSR